MTLKIQQTAAITNAIKLTEDCISYVRTSRDNASYDLKLSLIFDAAKILEKQAFKVKFYVQENARENLDADIKALMESGDIVKMMQAKSLLLFGKNTKPKILISETLDLTTALNNSSLNNPEKNYLTLNYLPASLTTDNAKIEVIQKLIPITKTTTLSAKLLSHKLLQAGKDPTSYSKTPENAEDSIKNSMLGTRKQPSLNSKDLFQNTLLQKNIKASVTNKQSLNKDSLIAQVLSEVSSNINFSKVINVKKALIKGITYYVYADLLNSKDQVLQSTGTQFNISTLINKSIIPRGKTPSLRLTTSNLSGKNSVLKLNLTNFDSLDNKKAKIFLKQDKDFKELTTVSSTTDLLNLSIPSSRQVVARAVYVDENGNLGHEFENVVLSESRTKYSEAFVISTQAANSVLLNLYNLGPNVVGFVFKYLDLTLKQKKPTILSPMLRDVSGSGKNNFAHRSPFFGHIYKYFATLFLDDGTTIDTKPDIVEIYRAADSGLIPTYSSLSVTQDEIFFNVNINFQEKPTNILLSAMQSLGIDKFFDNNIQNQLDKLQNLVNFIVFRINMSNGNREFLGVINNFFSEKRQSDITSAQKFDPNVTYQYHVYPTLTDVTTAFDNQNLIKTSNNLTDTNTQNYQKFKHVASIKNSMLVSARGLSEKFSNSILDFNVIGSPVVVNAISAISMSSQVINNLQYEIYRLNEQARVELSWNIDKSAFKNVDHFIVSRIVEGRQQLLGRCHAQSAGGNCNFIDILNEFGNITYTVLPIYHDYSYGNLAKLEIFIDQGTI
jgi:hypothetical protein